MARKISGKAINHKKQERIVKEIKDLYDAVGQKMLSAIIYGNPGIFPEKFIVAKRSRQG